jgi:DNA-binding beta-propeller fold protein YncE
MSGEGSMSRSLGVSILALALAACGEANKPVTYEVAEFIPPSPFHGLHGLAVEPDGTVLAGSVVGQAIYAVDPKTGAVTERIGPPDGMADDIAFGPDGLMAWTGYLTGKVFVQAPGSPPKMIASGLPGANSLAFSKDGKLYLTQVFLGDALYEVDWKHDTGARLIKEGLGGLNGFEVGPDGMIYGPLWFRGVIARVDPKTGSATDYATGFQIPAAANFGPDGNLYAIDTKTGEVKRIDGTTRQVALVATLAPAIDNLAFGPNGMIYVSNMADATIYEVDPATGASRKIVSGSLAVPTDLAIWADADGEKLHVADVFAYRTIDTSSKAIADPLRMYRDEVEYPLGVGAGATKIVVASWSTGTLQVLDRATGRHVAMNHGLAAPVDGLELADGRIIALEAGKGAISLIDPAAPSTADNPPKALVSGLNAPVAMAEATDGKIYVSETATGSLTSVDLASGEIVRLKDGLASPEGVDVGADGRVYVAEAGAGRVIAWDPKDKSVTTIAEGLKTGLPAVEGMLPAYTTTGVAVSKKDGAIYVASDITNAIYRIAPK